MSFLSDADAKRITEKVLGLATAPETVVYLNPSRGGNTRFARNEVTTSGYAETCIALVTSRYGLRQGSAQTNQIDDASLADVVRRAEEIARLAPEDPETMPVLGPQTYTAAPGLFSADADQLTADFRGKIVAEAIGQAKSKGLEAAGFVQNFSDADALATSRGLFVYRRTTGIVYNLTARSNDGGSGWGGGVSNSVAGFEPSSMTTRAMDIALRSAKPVALEPGNYTAILPAECVADLAVNLLGGFDQRGLDEGRSFLSQFQKQIAAGQKLFSEKVNLVTDPASREAPGNNFDIEGLPIHRTDWVKDGVVKSIACSRYWAKKAGREPLAAWQNLIMSGGTASIDEMVASTQRGLLVTRFWYVRPVDPHTALFTGLTRDGCFLVENGKVTRPVKNFRWNETPVKMLRNIEAMGPTRRVITSERDIGSALAFPALKVTDFTFSSLSDAV
ncbi:MAG TPA: metallopeptidase TldD-related protein [Myxococcaceae bacterium]|nr:metallopeptidase TldD-related protein [Myxococcaceae bacterium]